MAPTGEAYHVDWIVATNTNVHTANHRDWFTNYTPFESTVYSAIGKSPEGRRVEGIGDVVLPVKRDRNATGRSAQGTLTLHNVLYVPDYFCNIFGTIDPDQNFELSGQSRVVDAKTGAKLAIIDQPCLYRLRLTGQTATETTLEPGRLYMVNARWPASEENRWIAFKQQRSTEVSSATETTSVNEGEVPPYTTEEKQWLGKHWGNEYKFLCQWGWSISNEDDRAKGRTFFRNIKRGIEDGGGSEAGSDSDTAMEDDEYGYEYGGDDETDERSSFERDLEECPESHFADRHFSDDQLDWIKEHYRHSANFLSTHGLKFHDDGDCRAGSKLVEMFMKGGDRAGA